MDTALITFMMYVETLLRSLFLAIYSPLHTSYPLRLTSVAYGMFLFGA